MDRNHEVARGLSAGAPATETEVALCDFLLLLEADVSEGRPRSLSEYLTRFPGFETDIAREFLARLDRQPAASSLPSRRGGVRYQPGAIIGRGGMGEVRRARDLELDRELAMKTLHSPGPRARRRFLREASVTGRLDHPGVVPVHDVGTDADGRPFFTMRNVEGLDLEQVIERVRRNDPLWNLARALEVLIKVCDTMAFAHSRGVVHRDLKPSNIRVGRFGEVYVMDWGLARVLAEPPGEERSGPEPDVELGADLSALTLDGDVLGTPAYMAPEQAEGKNESVGKAADVYAVGALLYQLLSGSRPYGSDGQRRSPSEVLELVRTRAPDSLQARAARAPRELVAICQKAMQREPSQRYAEMEAVGRDLRAFLDRRLVSAYDTGFIERAFKWARRNRSWVAPVVVVLAVAGLATELVRQGRTEGRQRLVQLSRSQVVAAFDSLWPPNAANEPALASWLQQAEEILSTRDEDLEALEALKLVALPMDPDAPAERVERDRMATSLRRRRSLIQHFAELAEQIERGERVADEGQSLDWVVAQVAGNQVRLEQDLLEQPKHLTFRFADEDDQVLFDALTLLVSVQQKLLGTEQPFGLVDLARWGLGATRRVEELSRLEGDEWELARRSIASRDECPFYRGLELSPQLGLLPIGRDPLSGLWEFAHMVSGEVPTRAADGRLRIDEHSAIVLVLVPGGTLLRGAQRDDPSAPNYDPWCEPNASGSEVVELKPFFLSKYELTQAQVLRVAGRNPSACFAGDPRYGVTSLHPVENLAFDESQRLMRVLGLCLPTEAQWEWAAGSGADTPWHSGTAPEAVAGYANVADRSGIDEGSVLPSEAATAPDFDDGFPIHAPVGSLKPNSFGLHDTMGNVREWCRDTGPFEYRHGLKQIETGERIYQDDGTRAVRGGSFAVSVLRCRSAARDQVGPLLHGSDLGLRPAREIEHF